MRSPVLVGWFVAVSAVWGGDHCSSAELKPSPAALALIEKVPARGMGTDRFGNLWILGARRVVLISPRGSRLGDLAIGESRAVDADAEWGVLALEKGGFEAQRWTWDGQPGVRLRFSDQAVDIAWLAPDEFAVTPQALDHRVEIWDLSKRTARASWGSEAALHPATGLTRMRAVLLRYDFNRHLLYSLDSFTGNLQVFAPDGRIVESATVGNPAEVEWLGLLRDADEKAKQARDVQELTVFGLRLALSADGTPYTVQFLPASGRPATLVPFSNGHGVPQPLKDEPCPSSTFTLWGDLLISYRDGRGELPACIHARRGSWP